MDRIGKLIEFLAASPQDSFLLHALAMAYIKTGEEQKARELFESVLSREPGYIGSYYHLGKLLERTGEPGEAVKIYEKGMEQARLAGDHHAYSELRSVYEELLF